MPIFPEMVSQPGQSAQPDPIAWRWPAWSNSQASTMLVVQLTRRLKSAKKAAAVMFIEAMEFTQPSTSR